MNKMGTRVLALLLVVSLVGCGSKAGTNTDNAIVATENDPTQSESIKPDKGSSDDNYADSTEIVDVNETSVTDENQQKAEEEAQHKAEEEAQKKVAEEKRLAEQRNSFSMMYYLAITAEEIRTSKDNRIALEDIYTSLLNDTNPGAIDEITQDHLKNLRDIIKSYLEISTKRERLQFIYNQEKAAAIRNAVPNPLAILSVASVC